MRTGGNCRTVDREISRFPRKERLHMPGSSTTPGRSDLAMVRPKRVAFRARNSVGTRGLAFAAQWLAYALPCRRFAGVLTDANARASVFHPSSGRPDCMAGHVRLELRNVAINYPFVRAHRFAGIQPNSEIGRAS